MVPFRSSAAASAALGALLAAAAFASEGGNQLGRMALVESAIVLGTGLALAFLALRLRTDNINGTGTLLLFVAFAGITALSAAWSIAPDDSVQEAARTFSYLAVFAVAVAGAHLRPRAAAVVARGVLIAAVAVCGWALLTRVFPGALAETVFGTRLGEPFDYWNALGAMAALALPLALWLGARRDRHPLTTALAYPATGVLTLTLLLTQSRGALAAAVVGAVLWLALVPLRLRSIVVILLSVLASAPVAAWALSKDAFTEPFQALSVREAVAGDFGLMLLALCVLLLAAGLAVELVGARRPPSLAGRRRAGTALVATGCVLALAGLVSVAVSDRGLGGTVSDRVDDLTSEGGSTPAGAARLGSVSSSRSQYWRQAGRVFEERPLLGRGANSFGLARLPYRKDGRTANHAHGFVAQTLADLGLLGMLAVLALLAAWLAAAARATGLTPGRRRRPEWGDERTAVVALALCAIVFGAHSAVDWTWFVPGPSLAALVAAGFVAGRGAPALAGAPPGRVLGGHPAGGPDTGRIITAAALAVTALLCAWAVWQPERAARATDRTYELLDEGETGEAVRQVERAREIDPYSPDPLYATAAVLASADRLKAAYQTLEQAVLEHPRDPETWVTLATFELDRLDLPERALATLAGGQRIDPLSQRIPPLMTRARAELAPVPGDAPAEN